MSVVVWDKKALLEDVVKALVEDVGARDLTAALLPKDAITHAEIISREPMVVCGIPWVNQVFFELNPRIKLDWQVNEGDFLSEPCVLVKIYGPTRAILMAERAALNFLQTLSGTATETRRYVACLDGYHTQLLDTRKTLPGLRQAQKYAVRCGGGVNHRFGLYDAVLIKENHIKACGSITEAVKQARQQGLGNWIEVEVESLDEFKEALVAAPDRILLDNFDQAMLIEAVAMNKNNNTNKKIILEASGGVELATLSKIAETGVDYISVGAITKSVRAIDLSLLLKENL
ncbi:MAG: carboxylating nicotinate-nucleotide diphosphorylase [Legionellaceae bacterium]|nr:carboxylating nicotinate-nucleotide diphosphorylase [Legionellaceae bacterium]